MKSINKILIAIALIVIVEAVIYFFFAFCNWEVNWLPNSGGFARFIYAGLAFFGFMSAVSFVSSEIED